MRVINVQIRHEYDLDPVHLMTWDPERIDAVVPLLERLGLHMDGYDEPDHGWTFMPQLRHDGIGAYLEIVVSS